MYKKITVFVLFGLVFMLIGCQKHLNASNPTVSTTATPAKTYYTQFSLFKEKNNFRTTNYRKGTLIPINTPVILQTMNEKEAELRLVNGGTLTIENVPKHTVDTMQTAFNKIFGLKKVDLTPFSPAERDAIMAGQVIKGMNRKAVIAAIGYPPKHQTPSLTADNWTYWSNRFDRFIVRFKNNKVVSISE